MKNPIRSNVVDMTWAQVLMLLLFIGVLAGILSVTAGGIFALLFLAAAVMVAKRMVHIRVKDPDTP